MPQVEEEIPICKARYPHTLCRKCDHGVDTHSEMGVCATLCVYPNWTNESGICACPEWIDSGIPEIYCEEKEGVNATTDPVVDEEEDLDGNKSVVVVEPGKPVHVHKGRQLNDRGEVISVVRWESSND